jgi:hypothetical protein
LAEITSDADLYKKMSDTIAFIHKKQEEAYKEDPISIPKGLYPVLSNIDTGVMSSNARITFGGLADSFYECTCFALVLTFQRFVKTVSIYWSKRTCLLGVVFG